MLARMRKEGEIAIHMPEQLRVEAMTCAEYLRPYGKTLTEATQHFIAYLRSIERSCTVQTVISEFKISKKQDGKAKSYLRDIKHRLDVFENSFKDRLVAGVEPFTIDDWLRSLNVAGQTRNNFRTVIGTLFEFAQMRGYCASNPVSKIGKAKVVRGEPGIFTPHEMQRLLEKAPDAFIPYLAIGGFAGLRPEETEGLDWSNIDLERRVIHVKALNAKTAQRRLVTITDNLAAWLAPHAKDAGPVVSSARALREKTCRAANLSWKYDGLRHSFASYHLAHKKNADHTAHELGHASSKMLYQHYRELVRPEVAAQWWQIMPPEGYANTPPANGRKQ